MKEYSFDYNFDCDTKNWICVLLLHHKNREKPVSGEHDPFISSHRNLKDVINQTIHNEKESAQKDRKHEITKCSIIWKS